MTKAERQRIELEMSRKTYDSIPTEDMLEKVRYIEGVLNAKLDLWSDEETYQKYQKINTLNLSDKRLIIVYSLLDGSVAKTATFFSVNRKTIQSSVERIKEQLGLC